MSYRRSVGTTKLPNVSPRRKCTQCIVRFAVKTIPATADKPARFLCASCAGHEAHASKMAAEAMASKGAKGAA